jgi:hypothetical protein
MSKVNLFNASEIMKKRIIQKNFKQVTFCDLNYYLYGSAKIIVFVLMNFIYTNSIFAETVYKEGDQPFKLVNPKNTRYVTGNYIQLGNTVECVTNNEGWEYYDNSIGGQFSGSCQDNKNLNDNNYVTKYIDIDNNNRTWNSTSSSFTLPKSFDENKNAILWAGVFWQGSINNYPYWYDRHWYLKQRRAYIKKDGTIGYVYPYYPPGNSRYVGVDLRKTDANKILIKTDTDNGYTPITADTLYYDLPYQYQSAGGYYAAYADITSFLKSKHLQAGSTHSITVANITTNEGREPNIGNYAGWTIIIIYGEKASANTKSRNISIYNGYSKVDASHKPKPIEISGFKLPEANDVSAQFSVFAGEGEWLYGSKSNEYDRMYISKNSDLADKKFMPGALDKNNIFDARFSSNISRNQGKNNDLKYNTNGIDIDSYNVSKIMTEYRNSNKNISKVYIGLESNRDYITASMMAFSVELYQPNICYDYTYGQNGNFITAQDRKGLTLEGSFDVNSPINVKLYLRNKEKSDVTLQNVSINIENIDTKQAIYRRQSTYIAPPGMSPSHLDDAGRDVANDHDRNITIGNVEGDEHFYVYYGLDINKSHGGKIKMPIDAWISYDLVVDIAGTNLYIGHRNHKIADFGICQDDNVYRPTFGEFNVVHPAMQKGGNPDYYYNLPTQVVDRAERYKLEFMVPGNDGKYNQYADTDYLVAAAVETISADGFHYTDATCTDENATVISHKRVWGFIGLTNKHLADLNETKLLHAGIFSKASSNAAFLITAPLDSNGSLIIFDKLGSDSYRLHNVLGYGNDTCKNSNSKIADKCGGELHLNQVKSCLQCIYGYATERLCSRDNFAIRPESFYINVIDKNGSSSSTGVVIANNTPAPTTIDLAAGYTYDFEVNATTYKGNFSSPGYTTKLDTAFQWAPSPSRTVSGCNDTTDKNSSFNFIEGAAKREIIIDQVGEYDLNLTDSLWTRVDHIPLYMTHHVTPYFKDPVKYPDCLKDSNKVEENGTAKINGCDISVPHSNPKGTTYSIMHVTLHPYDINISAVDDQDRNKTFYYINNIADNKYTFSGYPSDKKQAMRIKGLIKPEGKDHSQLNNFVSGCYAEDINFTYTPSETNVTGMSGTKYLLRYREVNATNDTNDTKQNITIHKAAFKKTDQGVVTLDMYLNFDRNISDPVNPTELNITKLSADCTPSTNCQSNADGIGSHKAMDVHDHFDAHHWFYYGWAKPSQFFYDGITGSSVKTPISTVVYSDNPVLMSTPPLSSNLSPTNDYHWYRNTQHTEGVVKHDGGVTISTTNEQTTINGQAQPSNPYFVTFSHGNDSPAVTISYSGARPKTIDIDLKSGSNPWLLYNPDKSQISSPYFRIRFISTGAWSTTGNLPGVGSVVGDDVYKKKANRVEW